MAGAKPGVHCVQLKPIHVPESLTQGSKFIKWEDNSTIGVPVTLRVDEKGYILYWKDQNKEMDYLDISLIRDTRTGKYARIPKEAKLRDSLMIGDVPLEDRTVSVGFGSDFFNIEWINFVGVHKQQAQEWADEILKYSVNLLANNASALSYLEKAYIRFSRVLGTDSKIPIKTIVKMLATHREDRKRVEKALEVAGHTGGKGPESNFIIDSPNPGSRRRRRKGREGEFIDDDDYYPRKNDVIDPAKFTFEQFFNFYRHLVGRMEVDKVFDEIGAKKKPYLTVDQFTDFLNKQQRDPRLNEILYPFVTVRQAQELVEAFETKAGMPQKGHLSQEGFLKFLMSEENNLIPPEKLDLSEDMSQPLAHYFINSSHNTYLTGHQFTGKSSVEIYRQVLLSGCRCIELDCWDGKTTEEEPVITHGYTMCTEVLFKDVVEAIAESAFKTSDYPVILSFENHCTQKQQAKMANYCRTILGDMLLTQPLESHGLEPSVDLPSPALLRRKIIIKNKKKHYHRGTAQLEDVKPKSPSKTAVEGGKVKTSEERETPGQVEGVTSAETGEVIVAVGKTLSISSDAEKEGEVGDENVFDSDSDTDDSDEEDEDEVPGETEEMKKQRQREKRERGTAGSEAEAGWEMSALVNYIQPVHFHSFELSEKRARSYEISSFVETQATNLLKEYPVEFVNYNKRQLSRIYPRGTRVDSGNFMPQVFWNAGCQFVALNFQTLDLAMQLNLGIFEYNGRSGYILKPDFMRRKDRHFDPFAESTVDGIVAGTLAIRVISGQFLTDKKVGNYVEVDMFGLPTDTVRKKFRTKTIPANGINPVYDEEPFVFKKVVLPNLATIRIAVYEEQGKLIGHRILPVEGLRPGYRHIPLRNEANQPLMLPTLFVHISVKDYVPDKLEELARALSDPIAYQSNIEKHAEQLEVLTEDFELEESDSVKEMPGQQQTTAEKVQQRQDSITSRRNGAVSQVPSGGNVRADSTKRLGGRAPSAPHMTINKQDSCVSNISQASSGSDAEMVAATPLPQLRLHKAYLKAMGKHDKELETLHKKHTKAQDALLEQQSAELDKLYKLQARKREALEKTHSKTLKKATRTNSVDDAQQRCTAEVQSLTTEQEKEIREKKRTHAQVLVAMYKDHFQAEYELHVKHHEPLYQALNVSLDESSSKLFKRLDEVHEKEVSDLRKRMDAQNREHMKTLAKKHKDRQELSRIKREEQKKYVNIVVQERQTLAEILDKKKEELKENIEAVRRELASDKEEALKKLKEELDSKCEKLLEQFQSQLDGTADLPPPPKPGAPSPSPQLPQPPFSQNSLDASMGSSASIGSEMNGATIGKVNSKEELTAM